MSEATERSRAPRNRTLTMVPEEYAEMKAKLLCPDVKIENPEDMNGQILWGDTLEILDKLPASFVDLMILDPPYSIAKKFHNFRCPQRSHEAYITYLESWFPRILRLLKPTASVYLCGDWKCSTAGFLVMSRYLKIQNRIIWQREKGRGAQRNWKNCCEDIWFGTLTDDYYFDVEAVKIRRKVVAPYRSEDGSPKDWEECDEGNFRMTFPSNFWDDISIPYWSMPENTDHPTQKPEKLIAKLILASSRPGDWVFDPFLGSGTTAVTAKKLGRRFSGIELNEKYCCWAQKRLEIANMVPEIQGYKDGIFWERNTLIGKNTQKRTKRK